MKRGSTGDRHTTSVVGEPVLAFIRHPLPPRPPLDLSQSRQRLLERAISTALRVFRKLCERPLITLNQVCKQTGLSFPAAAKAMQTLEGIEIVHEITGQRRNRVFAYQRYLGILSEGTEPL